MTDPSRELLLNSVKSQHNSTLYSDLTITCGNNIYSVHAAIVCPSSGFLAGNLSFAGQETARRNINLPEDDPNIIKLFIRYLY